MSQYWSHNSSFQSIYYSSYWSQRHVFPSMITYTQTIFPRMKIHHRKKPCVQQWIGWKQRLYSIIWCMILCSSWMNVYVPEISQRRCFHSIDCVHRIFLPWWIFIVGKIVCVQVIIDGNMTFDWDAVLTSNETKNT